MFLSRIRWKTMKDTAGLPTDEYDLHRRVWEFFGDREDRKRDFLYRVEEGTPGLTIWTVSARAPQAPDAVWEVESKQYQPVLEAGDRFSFLVRVNPVRAREGNDGRHARHDVVMDEKTRLKNSGAPREGWPTLGEIVQEQGLRWLEARQGRGGYAVQPDGVRAESYRQRAFHNKGARITIATLDFHGSLTVMDAALFRKILLEGIGPAKGFGCGLMLVRRER